MTTRIETIPGNFNTGLTINDLPIPKEDLLLWLDASSGDVSPSSQFVGENQIDSLTDLNNSINYPLFDLATNFRVNQGGVSIASSLFSSGTSFIRRNGFKLPPFYADRQAVTICSVFQASNHVPSSFSTILFGAQDGSLSSGLIVLQQQNTESLQFALRHSSGAEPSYSKTMPVQAGRWYALIWSIDYAVGFQSFTMLDEAADTATDIFTGQSGPSGAAGGKALGLFGRHSEAEVDTQRTCRGGWKNLFIYDGKLNSTKRRLVEGYLRSIKDRLNAE